MLPDLRLGYLVFEVRRLPRWSAFCQHMLGLPVPVSNTDASLGWQLDEACHRLIVQEGSADDLAALGLECSSGEVLDRLVPSLSLAGIATEPGDASMCAARRVQRLHRCVDPCGNVVELFTGLEKAAAPF